MTEPYFRESIQPGQPLITIIGFWPSQDEYQGEAQEFMSRMFYRTATIPMNLNLQLVSHPDEAVPPKNIPIICMEEPHADAIDMAGGFVHPPQATYIIGNGEYQLPSDHFKAKYILSIPTANPEAVDIAYCGAHVAMMVAYDRLLKNSDG